ncbi:MAG: DUF3108 domain-containing protein [Acidobacteria bacterium]|nr:MAG: DUF3108 domain-containing protein [Acidobacteriota bacterium]
MTRPPVRAFVLYLLSATALTWPLVLHPFSRLAAPIGPGDPYLNLWILGWDLRTLGSDPLALLTGRVFQANIFFPAEQTLAFSDHLLLQALIVWPLWAVTHDLVFCYNALLFLSFLASAWTMYLLARAVTGSAAGACLAGFAWGFLPFRYAHLLHLQLQSLYFLPLAFLFLHRLMAGRRRRDAAWLGVCAALQAISSVYWGVIGAIGLVAGATGLMIGIGRWRSLLIVRRLVLAGVLGAALVAPVAWPYWQVQRREGFSRNLYEAAQHAASPASYLRVPPGNLLYGRTGLLRAQSDATGSRRNGPERELFPGLTVLALAAVGVWRGWRGDARPTALAMLLVAGLGFVLSSGPDGFRWLYSLFHRGVFGFQAIRAPGRFGALTAFSLVVLAALGLRELMRALPPRAGRSRALALGATGLLVLEFVNVPLPTVPAPRLSTPAGEWLAAAEGPGAVLYLPLDADLGNTPPMLDSLQHGRPIVNGYSGQRPSFYMGLVDRLNTVPSAEALWELRDLGVRFVVSPAALPGMSEAALGPFPLVERARFAEAVIYEMTWSEEAEALVPRPDPPPPMPPGAMPFVTRERAVYRVMWLSGSALGVPAGEATLTAERLPEGGAGEAWQAAVALRTAGWVSQFFEAHDRLETWIDASLLPLRHEQHLREGRRVVDRTTRFDHAAGTFRIADGPTLRLPPQGRDGLSAFLYARTLPLAPGFKTAFPVLEGGRTYTVSLAAEGTERIGKGADAVDALRVVPQFLGSGGRQRALKITLFLSPDARRVPILILLDAGFGSFRLELASYESE